ncbi:LysR family transcriptional regulator [Photobacterium aphoticum]|uniref:LysR family transcriptional regulator n=1 Tax=Photobacterium aphoticum TaxID=754436 RepID=A0A0J1JJV0_9GAMM|nr:LysR family transcriptional regulator [Photobacterium aphoticum]KLV02272.1 LysR family transcriptional regulator [Photobacterium aphoticum]PSU57747.1 LysR family transcriptional regulator [Photobacterium aphoticum]GHA55109.1 transcriptional regulator [Photobacterium aphoticum]
MRLKTTLDQWLTLHEIDRHGSIQAAATALNKSHTTLIYAVRKLEDQLGVTLVTVEGRRAVLSEDGKALVRRASSLLDQARDLEHMSQQLSQGVESEITVAVDHLCDRQWLYGPLATFLAENTTTSVQIIETSLSGTTDAVLSGKADIAIINLPVTNYPAEALGTVNMIPVVAKHHPLAQQADLHINDLTTQTQIVIRDLGADSKLSKQNVGWLKSQQRITVDNFDHAWQAVKAGLGFCRLPQHWLNRMGRHGEEQDIVQLDIAEAHRYQVPIHVTLPHGVKTGPAAKQLYALICAQCPHTTEKTEK